MGKYIHLFSAATDFNVAYKGDAYNEPWVSLTEEGEKVNYNKSEEEKEEEELEKMKSVPLTFEIIEDGDVMWTKSQMETTTKYIYYSKNGGEWTRISPSSAGTPISVVAGDVISFKGTYNSYGKGSNIGHGFHKTTAKLIAYGNPLSLVKWLDFSGTTTMNIYGFCGLFYNCIGMIDASKMVLPATTLAESCYEHMFSNCVNLVAAPKNLPATEVPNYGYAGMFSGCTSLVTAPELPATALAKQCYNYMFANCTSLTSAPAVLPGTDFSNAQHCYDHMFAGCTSLTTAPELPAQTVTKFAYECMFQNCTNLNYIKCLATGNNIGPNYTSSPCYQWVAKAGAPTGTFVKAASMTAWQRNNSGVPAGWAIQDA